MAHLYVALSAHGYGHVAQTAPVVNALRARHPELCLTLATCLPKDFLAARFDGPFHYEPSETDVGMAMTSAIDVDTAQSHAAYRRFHEHWEARVAAAACRLAATRTDLVLADVPYLVLAAARRTGIPALAMCSLNWADIYAHYASLRDSEERVALRAGSETAAILTEITEAYRSAHAFLRLTPGMAMTTLSNVREIGPVARLGKPNPARLRKQLGAAPHQRLVMVAPGGIELRLPIETWPDREIFWIVPSSWQVRQRNVAAFEDLKEPFVDVLSACNAVVGKPGYGTFVEAACNGVPMVYVRRGDWPEEPALIEWMKVHARSAEVTRRQLHAGAFLAELDRLWATPAPRAPEPAGIREAVEIIVPLLRAR